MPEADGFELMELIQTGLNLSTPVVMMSTDDGDVRLKSLRSGAAQFLPKPVRPDELQSLWQVGLGGSAGPTPAGTPRAGSFDGGAGGPARSISLDQLDEAGVAAGMTAGAVLQQRRSDEMARSAPGGEAGFPQPVSSSRVERLLKEREMRRVRSLTGLAMETLGLEAEATEAAAPSPQPLRTREPSLENLAALAEPEPRQRLIVVANRLPVSAKKRPDGAWALEVRSAALGPPQLPRELTPCDTAADQRRWLGERALGHSRKLRHLLDRLAWCVHRARFGCAVPHAAGSPQALSLLPRSSLC